MISLGCVWRISTRIRSLSDLTHATGIGVTYTNCDPNRNLALREPIYIFLLANRSYPPTRKIDANHCGNLHCAVFFSCVCNKDKKNKGAQRRAMENGVRVFQFSGPCARALFLPGSLVPAAPAFYNTSFLQKAVLASVRKLVHTQATSKPQSPLGSTGTQSYLQ